MESTSPGSDRAFGFVFAAALAALGAYALWSARPWGWAAIAAGALLALVAFAAPRRLHAANRLWHGLGLLLGRIVNPIVVALLFFVVITPAGLALRALGRRPLSLRFDERLASYWIERAPRGPLPASMRDQF